MLPKSLGSVEPITIFNLQVNKKLLFLFSCSIIICIITAFKHEMWGDEAQAFLIARDSASFSDLFKNVRYEGHPSLWHLLIKLSIFFIPHFYVIQVLNVLAGIGIFTIIYFYSPFRLYQKFLIASSYFISYEWIIVSRCYAIGVFFLLLALVFNQRMQQESKYIFIAVALGLAINSSGHAMIVGVCLGAYLFLSEVRTKKSFLDLVQGKKLTGILILAISLGLYLLQTYPPADRFDQMKISPWSRIEKTAYSLKNLTKGYFFIQRAIKDQPVWQNDFVINKYSNQVIIAGKKGNDIFYLLAGIAVVVGVCFTLKRKAVFFFYVATNCTLFLAGYISPQGLNLRHFGFYFLTFIIAAWLDKKNSATNPLLNFILIPILFIQFVSALIMHVMDWKMPFSNAKMTAQFLTVNKLDTLKTFGHFWQTSPVIAYTGAKDVVMAESGTRVSFVKLDSNILSSMKNFPLNKQTLESAILNSDAEILLLTPNDTLTDFIAAKYKKLTAFDTPSLQWFEQYIIYKKAK